MIDVRGETRLRRSGSCPEIDVMGRLASTLRRTARWGPDHVPRAFRMALGLLLVVAGAFGFLPVLGFWIIAVGAVLIARDLPRLRRARNGKDACSEGS